MGAGGVEVRERKEGRREGGKVGRREGRKEGRKEGWKEGRKEGTHVHKKEGDHFCKTMVHSRELHTKQKPRRISCIHSRKEHDRDPG